MEPTIDTALTAVRSGKFGADDYGKWSYMGVKGSELAPLGSFEKRVPPELMKRVKDREAAILAGKFTVKIDDGQPKSTAK